MKIAVASDGKDVAQHFGHCEGFHVFEQVDGALNAGTFYPNPGHKPGFLPVYLHELGVDTVISGGMGGGAIAIFKEKGIHVVTGASGDSKAAAENYMAGRLISNGSVCKEHQHHDTCGGH